METKFTKSEFVKYFSLKAISLISRELPKELPPTENLIDATFDCVEVYLPSEFLELDKDVLLAELISPPTSELIRRLKERNGKRFCILKPVLGLDDKADTVPLDSFVITDPNFNTSLRVILTPNPSREDIQWSSVDKYGWMTPIGLCNDPPYTVRIDAALAQ